MDKALQTMKEIYDKFVSSYNPSPTLSLEQNLSVWFEQNKNYLQALDEGLTEEERKSLKNSNDFIASLDMPKLAWAMSWPEGKAWREAEDDKTMNWSINFTFIRLFEWLDKHTTVDDPYVQSIMPEKIKHGEEWEKLYFLKQVGLTFQEIAILVSYFWRKDRAEQLRQKYKEKDEHI